MNRLIRGLLGLLTATLLLLLPCSYAQAKELTPQTSGKGSTLTVTAKDGSLIGAVYVKWNKEVKPYTLITDSEELPCGGERFSSRIHCPG